MFRVAFRHFRQMQETQSEALANILFFGNINTDREQRVSPQCVCLWAQCIMPIYVAEADSVSESEARLRLPV